MAGGEEEEEEQGGRGGGGGEGLGLLQASTPDGSMIRGGNLRIRSALCGPGQTLMILTVLKRSISSKSSPCSSFLICFRRARRSSLSFSFSSALARLRAPSAAAPLARARGIFLHYSRPPCPHFPLDSACAALHRSPLWSRKTVDDSPKVWSQVFSRGRPLPSPLNQRSVTADAESVDL